MENGETTNIYFLFFQKNYKVIKKFYTIKKCEQLNEYKIYIFVWKI